MGFTQKTTKATGIVYLYDPVPLDRVQLDILKECFSKVVSMSDEQMILAQHSDPRMSVEIQIARLMYNNESAKEFAERNFQSVKDILRAMPPIHVRAFGVNLHLRVVMPGFESAGTYSTQSFLANHKKLEEKLDAEIIGSAHRFVYGNAANYFELRLTPLELGSEWLHLQLHMHKELHLTDSDRIYEETIAANNRAIHELGRLEKILLEFPRRA